MIADIDIWRAAHLMVTRYGEDAAFEAAQCADRLLAEGYPMGCAVWKRVLAAIEDLQRQRPAPGKRPH